MPDANPYTPPAEVDLAGSLAQSEPSVSPRKLRNLLVAWPVVLGLNLIVPLLVASELLGTRGWTGVVVAIVVNLLVGFWLCHVLPGLMKRLIVGAAVVALSQLVPVLHLIAGMIAFVVGESIGLIEESELNGPEIGTAISGGVLTTLTGGVLMVASIAIGSVLVLLVGLRKRG